jgi:hypothetical protein
VHFTIVSRIFKKKYGCFSMLIFSIVISHARIHTRTTPFLNAQVCLFSTHTIRDRYSSFQLIVMSTETSPKTLDGWSDACSVVMMIE